MQGQLTRPTRADHIAYAGTPDELWWSKDHDEWVKPPRPQAPGMDRVIQAYDALRNHRAIKEAEHKKADADLEADMVKLRALLNEMMNVSGASSVKTEYGTAYRTEKLKVSAADWGALNDWILEDPSRIEIYEKRLKAGFVKDFMEQNENAIPPGVNVHRDYEVSVRRPTASAK